MKILYVGDIMGDSGIDIVRQLLPDLKRELKVDLTIAQAENVSQGKGMTPADMRVLQKLGIDFFTGGNHTPKLPELHSSLMDPHQPVIGPANMPTCPGEGYKYVKTSAGPILIICLLGKIVGKDSELPVENPLIVVDKILEEAETTPRLATIVNFHGDYSSEKVIIGHYLDGRVSAVIGDHWHVPTADARVLPKGTAYISDVGMCGVLNSSLGIKFENVISRWRDGKVTKNELETSGPFQLNAALIETDDKNNLSQSINLIQKVI